MRIKMNVSFGNDTPADYSGANILDLEFEHRKISVKDVLVFPGIVNAHDHLEFNLFPHVANGSYTDYRQWGADIHSKNKETIDSIKKIPVDLRLRWGVLKNLINGITHIVHHGGHHDLIKAITYPVFLNYQYLHSLATERYWKLKLNSWSNKSVMFHIGEGTSPQVTEEIDRVLTWNLLHRDLIGIHAIGMTPAQSKHFKSVVWCPLSNMNLYKATANVGELRTNTAILFGTDSTLTGSPNFWEHLRLARTFGMLSDAELYETVTSRPRNVLWEGAPTSVVVARKKADDSLNAFFELNPEDILLVVINGVVRLVDESILQGYESGFSRIQVGPAQKLVSEADASVLKLLMNYSVRVPLDVSLL